MSSLICALNYAEESGQEGDIVDAIELAKLYLRQNRIQLDVFEMTVKRLNKLLEECRNGQSHRE